MGARYGTREKKREREREGVPAKNKELPRANERPRSLPLLDLAFRFIGLRKINGNSLVDARGRIPRLGGKPRIYV